MYGSKYGKGKIYNKHGTLIFEGEFANNLENGNGKQYDDSGKLIYEGEFVNGRSQK